MKVYCIEKKGCLKEAERETPQLTADDQVLIKVKRVGICGSDMHIFHGTNPFATYPRIWGHEFAGEVVEVGSKVSDLKQGDHVVAEPFESCGKCYACKNGRGNVCESLRVYGVHLDGGCQEYIVMNQHKVHRIEKSVPWKLATLAEPLTIGFQATSRGRVRPGDTVLVTGAGTMGLSVLIAAKALKARVIITDLYDEKLEYAKKFGADVALNVRGKDLGQLLNQLGEKPNVIIDGVCTKQSLEQAVDMVSSAGRVVELGFGEIKSEIPHVTLMKKEVDVCGTRLQTGQFPKAIRYIEENTNLLDDFVTQEFSAEDVEKAFRFVSENPALVRKAQVCFE